MAPRCPQGPSKMGQDVPKSSQMSSKTSQVVSKKGFKIRKVRKAKTLTKAIGFSLPNHPSGSQDRAKLRLERVVLGSERLLFGVRKGYDERSRRKFGALEALSLEVPKCLFFQGCRPPKPQPQIACRAHPPRPPRTSIAGVLYLYWY